MTTQRMTVPTFDQLMNPTLAALRRSAAARAFLNWSSA
jgi:hypothetical protein